MTITRRHFKILLTWSWIVILVGVVIDIASGPYLPEALREYTEAEYTEEWSRDDWLLLTTGVPLLAAVVASYIGLYRFKRWGRSLWLWTGVVGCALTPAFGPSVYSAWAEPFHFLGAALYGVILALAFVPPVCRMIEGESGSREDLPPGPHTT